MLRAMDGRPLEVVLRARRYLLEDDLLGHPAAEHHAELVLELGLGHEVAVLGRELQGIAQGGDAALHDRHAVHGIGRGQELGHDGVAALVVGHGLLFLLVHHPRLLFQPAHDPVDGRLEVRHVHFGLPLARREQRGFVHDVRQVGAHEARRALREDGDVHVPRQLDAPDVDLQDLLAVPDVRPVHEHLAVEAAGPEQRGIEDLRAGWSRP